MEPKAQRSARKGRQRLRGWRPFRKRRGCAAVVVGPPRREPELGEATTGGLAAHCRPLVDRGLIDRIDGLGDPDDLSAGGSMCDVAHAVLAAQQCATAAIRHQGTRVQPDAAVRCGKAARRQIEADGLAALAAGVTSSGRARHLGVEDREFLRWR